MRNTLHKRAVTLPSVSLGAFHLIITRMHIFICRTHYLVGQSKNKFVVVSNWLLVILIMLPICLDLTYVFIVGKEGVPNLGQLNSCNTVDLLAEAFPKSCNSISRLLQSLPRLVIPSLACYILESFFTARALVS